MKQNWTYKRLGEVGQVITGNTPSTKDVENYASNDYCFVKPSDICVERISKITDTECHISSKGFLKSRQLPKGSVLTTCIGIIGKVGVLQKEATCNQQINAIIPSSTITSDFLAYAILNIRPHLELMANAPVVPIINKSDFSNILIPVPPLPEQQQIVSELDLLQGIIDKQKAQLKEYDTLAQSIFYDMFGDPVENEKGWEVKTLNEVCDVRDGTHDSPSYYEEGYPLVTSKNVDNGKISFDDVNYICKEDFDSISKRSRVDDGDIIMPMIGTIGKPVIVKKDREFAIKNVALIKFISNSKVINVFIQAIMSSSAFDTYMKSKNKGGTQKFIALGDIRKLKTPVPPLSLQQSFAAKIESIEKQKAAISKSIAETEKLFEYTMDKYFG